MKSPTCSPLTLPSNQVRGATSEVLYWNIESLWKLYIDIVCQLSVSCVLMLLSYLEKVNLLSQHALLHHLPPNTSPLSLYLHPLTFPARDLHSVCLSVRHLLSLYLLSLLSSVLIPVTHLILFNATFSGCV